VNMIQEGRIALDKPTSETSVEEITNIVVDEYRRAREEEHANNAHTEHEAPRGASAAVLSWPPSASGLAALCRRYNRLV